MMETLAVGPIVFLAPLALLALIGLPILWLVLRATPPQPVTIELPSLALLDGLIPEQETPAKTPWWIILLRMAAVLLIILGLANPVWSPNRADTTSSQNDVVVLIESDWVAAPNWSAYRNAALNILSSLDNDQQIRLIPTTTPSVERAFQSPTTPLEAKAKLRALRPSSWRVNTDEIITALGEVDLSGVDVYWVTSGIKQDDHEGLNEVLSSASSVSVVIRDDQETVAIIALSASPKGPVLSLVRSQTGSETTLPVSAFDERSRSVVSAEAVFDRDQAVTTVTFEAPDDVQAQIRSFRVLRSSSAAGVWFWQGSSRARRVGILSSTNDVQPLLSDAYYVRKALSPFATLFEGDLETLFDQDLGAIILTDVGRLNETDEAALSTWVEEGGVLIRFAGPRLAAQSDTLLPVTLRRASRAFDSALSWDDPQQLDRFPDASPFALTEITSEVSVRRQVLAQPEADLPAKTWARLTDGTPIVTADRLGDGRIVLFHVTASPDWSDLPLSGVFVDMLRQITLPARELNTATQLAETSLSPVMWLDGFGDPIAPSGDAKPLEPLDALSVEPSKDYPSGLYRSGAVSFPLNAGQRVEFERVSSWPSSFSVMTESAGLRRQLGGWLLGGGAVLLLIDLIVALAIAGSLTSLFRRKAARKALGLVATVFIAVSTLATSDAQTLSSSDDGPKAALGLQFAYLETDDRELNRRAAAGLRGLSLTLFRRTTVEPVLPAGISFDALDINLYPFLLILMPDEGLDFSEDEKAALSDYMANGGAVLIDTRQGGRIGGRNTVDPRLVELVQGLDLPPLERVSDEHVLTRAFYLLDDFRGKYAGRPLWVETNATSADGTPKGDGISTLFLTDADMATAWAVDDRNQYLYSVDGGERGREMARRSGVNIIMYILTGNYKEDQVHLPSLLERLGEDPPDGRGLDLRPDRNGGDE